MKWLAETQQKKKKRKKQQLAPLEQVQEEVAVENATKVMEVLDELEKEGVHLDIQVCPKCKSPRVRRAKSTGGDMWGHVGMLPPSYECPDCGWQERVVVKASNRRWSVRDIELIREAMEIEKEKSR